VSSQGYQLPSILRGPRAYRSFSDGARDELAIARASDLSGRKEESIGLDDLGWWGCQDGLRVKRDVQKTGRGAGALGVEWAVRDMVGWWEGGEGSVSSRC
jgi:hypothetical protein